MVQLAPDVVIAGKLRLLRPLGHGGMGVVWAARHLSLETDVAVKLIRPERAAEGPALLARFEREARATARIAHPHVVKVMDYGAVGGVPYIVMELLRGFSLAELLERGGRLSLATARSLVEQIGGALESAHEQGVVHRDIKPHNVFITEGSKGYPLFVKVLDFGVAKMVGGAEPPGPSTALTETGVVIGSAPYMSPEQLEGRRDVDLRTDLWSLAIIVYEVLTGERPFQGGSFVSVGAAVLRGRYRPVTELRPNLPPSLDDWFAKALSLDPDARFASAREMVSAFTAQARRGPDEEAPSLSTPPAAAPRDSDAAFASTVTAPSAALAPEAGGKAGQAPAASRGVAGTALLGDAGGTADHAAVASRGVGGAGALVEAGGTADHAAASSGVGGAGALVEAGGTADHAAVAVRGADGTGALAQGGGRAGWPARRWVAVGAGAAVTAVAAAAAFGGLAIPSWNTQVRGCPAGMKLIEGATFPMGSPEGGETPGDETPVHPVAVAAFCLDATEVTVGEYEKCESCERPARTVEIEGLTPNARSFWSDFCNGPAAKGHPQNCVDWYQAGAYCAAAGKRLPTEAEWELAARGVGGRTYPWGPQPPSGQRLNACGSECSKTLTERFERIGKGPWPAMHPEDDAAPATAAAGRYPSGATPEGVLDLAGNVWEWTDSHYCPYSNADCGDSRRVLRGGGWDTVDSLFVRAAHRRPSAPTARGWSIGFRCAKTP